MLIAWRMIWDRTLRCIKCGACKSHVLRYAAPRAEPAVRQKACGGELCFLKFSAVCIGLLWWRDVFSRAGANGATNHRAADWALLETIEQLWHTAKWPQGMSTTDRAAHWHTTHALSCAASVCFADADAGSRVVGLMADWAVAALSAKWRRSCSARATKSASLSMCCSIFHSSYAQSDSSSCCADLK